MTYLLDTCIFLWLAFDPQRIAEEKLTILKNQKNKVSVSSLSFWEISLKFGLGKLELSGVLPDDLVNVSAQMGLSITEIDSASLSRIYKLPKVKNHKDPFDRAIISYCINNDIILVSNDRKFIEYEKYGLKTL